MLVFLSVVFFVCAALFQPLRAAFLANQVFNGMIVGVLLVGVVVNLRQVFALKPDINWIDGFKTRSTRQGVGPVPVLLTSIAKMMSDVDDEAFRLSAMNMRSLLDGIRLRLDESRDLSRYLTGLLIFLGLLGTFWGLLDTVSSAGNVIAGISAGGGDITATFDELKAGLQGPLKGMGTAFSSSLFGLSGALVLGFLDLQAGHAQNRFYNHLEEWLSDLTHLPSGTLSESGGGSLPSYIEALLEQTADSLHKLQRAMSDNLEDRRSSEARMATFTDKLSELTDQMRSDQKLIINQTKQQADLQSAIDRLADGASGGWEADQEVRNHVRNVDASMTRLVDEISSGRAQIVDEMREELRLLTRALSKK